MSDVKSKEFQEIRLFYIFNINQNDGFVMVSADNDVTPLLGYSTSGSYTGTNLPKGFQKLMEKYKQEILYVVVNQVKADNEINQRRNNNKRHSY